MPINLLFLCTGNSARSLIAEGVCANLVVKHSMRFQLGHIQLASPIRMPLRFCASMILTLGLRALKAGMNLLGRCPHLDLIITVCDNAAGETCPIWPGRPATAHWGLPDPAAVDGPQQAITAAFLDTYDELANGLHIFLTSSRYHKYRELAKQMTSHEVNK